MPEPGQTEYRQIADARGKLCGPPVPVAAIAGGVGGGIALIAIVAAVVIVVQKKRQQRGRTQARDRAVPRRVR